MEISTFTFSGAAGFAFVSRERMPPKNTSSACSSVVTEQHQEWNGGSRYLNAELPREQIKIKLMKTTMAIEA